MTLQEFCIRHSMPPTRTNRSVRTLALRALARANGLLGQDKRPDDAKREEVEDMPPEETGLKELEEMNLGKTELEEIALEEHRIDREIGGFIRVEKPEGHTRFSYEITDPERLAQWLAEKHGADLLTDRDVRLLLKVGRLCYKGAYDKGPWTLRSRNAGTNVKSTEPFRRLEETLRRVRALPDDGSEV